ncbi:MAG: ATP-binding protein [Myxococcota bacterium]
MTAPPKAEPEPPPPGRARILQEARRRLLRAQQELHPSSDPRELLEELQIHQIELEMQRDELRRTHHDLERSRDAYAELFDHAPIPFLSLDAAWRIEAYNEAASELLGPVEPRIGFLSFVARTEVGDVGTWLHGVSAEHTHMRDLTLMTHGHGARTVEVYARRGAHRGWLVSLVDVHDTRTVTTALRQREDDLRRLTDLAPDAVFVTTVGKIVYANHRFEEMVQRPRADVLGTMLHGYVHPVDRPELARLLAEGSDQAPRAPLRFVGTDGAERMVELRTMRLVYQGANATLLIGRDLTERRRLQARVERAERLATVGMLVAGVAHEVNNPLAYTISNLEVIANHLVAQDDADLQEAIHDALAGAQRVKDIVGDLRAFNRVDDEISVLEPNRVVVQALRMAQSEVAHRARLRRDLGAVTNLRGNESRLVQVVLNLVVNAAQAMRGEATDPDRNWIRIRTWQADEEVCIAIEDNGPGIDRENLERIFDPFFTTRKGQGGTGLGLAICNSLVQQMGGFIEVDSTPGSGSRFVVRLPSVDLAAPTPPAPVSGSRTLKPVGRRLCIVVIDDERAIVRSIKRLIGDVAKVHEAHSVTAARDRLQNLDSVDVILCDLVLDDGSGVEVGDWLRTEHPEYVDKLVYMTGMAHPDARAELGAPLLTKPFSKEVLVDMIESVLGANLTPVPPPSMAPADA